MFQRISRLLTALLLVSGVTLAYADSTPGIERPQAASGYGSTVIGRIFLGDGGNLSYLRFLNLSGNTATVSATGIPSAQAHSRKASNT